MPVKSFECAIARSQIGRYLAGDAVGDEAMRQLEAHISGCTDCQRLIDSKKQELLGPLAHAPSAEEALATSPDVSVIERELRAAAARSGRAVIEAYEPETPMPTASRPAPAAPEPTLSATAASNAAPSQPNPTAMTKPNRAGIGAAFARLSLPKLVRDVPDTEPAPVAAATTPPAMANARKPLAKAAVYGGALALVLGGMAFMGDPTALLGGKAEAAAPIQSKLTPEETKARTTVAPKATSVMRSAIGVPITDAADPSAVATSATAKKPAAKPGTAKAKPETLVAKGDSADLGPLEFDPTLDSPSTPVAVKPHGRPLAKAGSPAILVSKPHAVKSMATKPVASKPFAAKKAVVKPAPVKASTAVAKAAVVKPKVTKAPLVKASLGKAPIARKLVVAKKPVAQRPGVKLNRAKASTVTSGPVATVVPVIPVATTKTAKTTKSIRPASKRRTTRRARTVRNAAPKTQNVIRVYDETGKPIN